MRTGSKELYAQKAGRIYHGTAQDVTTRFSIYPTVDATPELKPAHKTYVAVRYGENSELFGRRTQISFQYCFVIGLRLKESDLLRRSRISYGLALANLESYDFTTYQKYNCQDNCFRALSN